MLYVCRWIRFVNRSYRLQFVDEVYIVYMLDVMCGFVGSRRGELELEIAGKKGEDRDKMK